MKQYQNIIFDFGNVIGRFHPDELLKKCCGISFQRLKDVIFHDWQQLDEGTISYDDYVNKCLQLTDVYEKEYILQFFQTWYYELPMIAEMNDWIISLKKEGYRIYLLSNAPVIFEEHIDTYPIMKYFDGRVLSASIRMSKPNSDIYEYLLDKYHLNASECFFIDDREENVEGALNCGIDAMVYHGNLEEIKAKIYNRTEI